MPGDNKPALPSAAPRSAGRDADARLTPRRRRWLLAQRLGESSSRRHRPAGAGAVDQYDVDRLGDVEDRVRRASLSSSRGAGEGHLLRQCVHLRVHSLPVLRSISTSATIATTAPERREQEMSRGALKPAQAKRDGSVPVAAYCSVIARNRRSRSNLYRQTARDCFRRIRPKRPAVRRSQGSAGP